MKTQITASVFWKLFQGHQSPESSASSQEKIEHMRHRCLLGLTAIDAAIATYWKEVLLEDWPNVGSLVNEVLEDDSLIQEYLDFGKGSIKKASFVATLRFVSNTGDPARFSPTLLDFACIMAIKKHPRFSAELFAMLCSLQNARNSVVHTGKDFSEILAFETAKKIPVLAEKLAFFHICFADAFGDSKGVHKMAA